MPSEYPGPQPVNGEPPADDLAATATGHPAGPVDALEDLMLATGAVAVTMEDNADQPVLEPGVGETPLWGQTRLTGLYPADTDMTSVLRGFPAELLDRPTSALEILEDKDWEREWMQHYQPMRFGSACGSAPAGWNRRSPTQSTCCWIRAWPSAPAPIPPPLCACASWTACDLRRPVVVDYGCGSGILAVAALKLGRRVHWG